MTPAAEAFTITLDGIEYPVVVEDDKIIVDGRAFKVSTSEEGVVLVDGIAYDVALEGDEVRAGDTSHSLEVSGLSLAVGAPATSLEAMPAADVGAGPGAVLAIMPGKITRVMVQAGDSVEGGEAVCVLEAMKMENELRAEREGTVKAVHVSAGDDVEKGQVLVEVE